MIIEKISTQGWNRLLRAVWKRAVRDLSCTRGKPCDYCYYTSCHDCKEWANHWCLTAVKTGAGRLTSVSGKGWLNPELDNISNKEKK